MAYRRRSLPMCMAGCVYTAAISVRFCPPTFLFSENGPTMYLTNRGLRQTLDICPLVCEVVSPIRLRLLYCPPCFTLQLLPCIQPAGSQDWEGLCPITGLCVVHVVHWLAAVSCGSRAALERPGISKSYIRRPQWVPCFLRDRTRPSPQLLIPTNR